MAVQINLFQIIFEEYLKISSDLISRYPTIQDQLLYLILIPHVVLLLFLFGFGQTFIHEHKGLRFLTTITAYIFILWAGWYGTFLVPLTIGWFYILLGIGFVFFFVGRVIHPSRASELFALSKAVGEKITEKSKKANVYEDEIDSLTAQINSFGHGPHQPQQQQYIDYLTAQRAALQNKLDKLR